MSISGRFVLNAVSVGNMKLCFKSVATCQSVQLSSNDGLRIFSHTIFEIFPSLTNWIALLLIIFRALLAVAQHVFETSEKISRTSLYLQVYLLRAYSHPMRICLRLAVFPHALHRSDIVNPKHEGWLVLVRRRRLILWGNLISLGPCAWGLSMWQVWPLHSST